MTSTTTEPGGAVARRLPCRLLLLALLAAGLAVTPATARAQSTPDADALGLEATAGIGGWTVGGTWTPVEVRLQPDAPFRGRILVAASGGGGDGHVITRAIEVGAQVTKAYHLLAPPAANLQVQVVADGAQEGATVRPERREVGGFLVGTIGDVDADAIPTVTSPTTDRQATVVPVDDRVLALGPRALDGISTLVVDHADLVGRSQQERDSIARAVADGAHLVVTGTTSTDLGLPWQNTVDVGGALQPAPGAWGVATSALEDGPAGAPGDVDLVATTVGRGRLVTAAWRPEQYRGATDVWEHLLQPTTTPLPDDGRGQLTNDVDGVFRARTGTPFALGWVAAFLVTYLVVVGPVLGLVLRGRRRPELAWVAVPVVTALFATAAFFGATGARPRVGVSGHVVAWADGVGTITTVAGVRSPQPGQHDVVLTGGPWDVEGTGWNSGVRVADTGDQTTTVELALPGFSFGAVLGRRPTSQPPPLEVEVALLEGEARVEVTNVGGQDLADVRVHLATDDVELAASLPAGDTAIETIPLDPQLPAQQPFRGRFDPVLPLDDDDPDPRVLSRLVRWSTLDGAPGLVWVTATSTGDLALPDVSVDGSSPHDRGTLVAVGVRPSPTDDATTPFEVQRDVLMAPNRAFRDAPLMVSGQGPATMRFLLPREGAVTGIDLQVDRTAGGGMVGRPAEPVPMPVPEEACGLLERRDAETGDLLEAEEHCGPNPPCPPDAQSCGFSAADDGPVEGEVCYRDGRCELVTWEVPPGALMGERPPPDIVQPAPGAQQMQVWDHLERRWVDLAAAEDPGEVDRWLGPLGDVWVRATGELVPFDLAPQGVRADLAGGA